MLQPIFITGIGTGIGKTIVSAVLVEALKADYWKPVQAGFADGTDAETVKTLLTNSHSVVHFEVYKLPEPSSPHIAAKKEGIMIELDKINDYYQSIVECSKQSIVECSKQSIVECSKHVKYLIIEGAGGLMVPLNENEFIIDLIKKLNAKVILVSRNYLGSINHSLLTAEICKAKNIDVIGWIFNDQYLNYENEIVQWTQYKKIASLPFERVIDKKFIKEEANKLKESLQQFL